MSRFGRLLSVLAGAILLGIAPAAAIETRSFGLDVAEASADGRLHVEVKAGETSTGKLRVWNKTDAPIRLSFSVVAASVDEAGAASLGGDDEPVSWVDVTPERTDLDPNEEAELTVKVSAPRKLDGDAKTVAVVAEPAAADGAPAPAVLERLAITTFLEPDEDSLIASLGPFPWIAGAVLLVAVILLARRMATKRGGTDSA